MSPNNFKRVFHAFKKRLPFRSFTLELINGQWVEVNHPEALSQQEDLVIFTNPGGTRSVFECGAVVRFVQGTSSATNSIQLQDEPTRTQRKNTKS